MKTDFIRKAVSLLFLSCMMTVPMQAQDVFKEIMRLSKNGAADISKSLDSRRVYQFKIDELNYMAYKMRECMPDSSVYKLDVQAYAMYDYIDTYFKYLNQYKKKKDKELVQAVFKAATKHNPMFNETDEELNLSYYNSKDYLIQFCLDCDWVKAAEEIRQVFSNL